MQVCFAKESSFNMRVSIAMTKILTFQILILVWVGLGRHGIGCLGRIGWDVGGVGGGGSVF
jgi:hypothetical protein